ncbi:MAG: site-specific DNA-methyltransferase, partial [Desulfuromonadales bacterium]|nr:site-specific DNA-methyltransferase [Desulfuromonadales bacterium]NIS41459.1 site-specific DNA-methyltransferase [Desulfuromonadales bacterium]
LSDPPYYTACPNPWLSDFVSRYGRPYDPDVPYHREPFAVDVSVGKTDALYKAHGYHTKVPHLAIVPSILHYTDPGDLVLDGFAGSGMTAVAAQWCGAAPDDYRRKIEDECRKAGRDKPRWGAR